jgi:ectoine hydroxylase-related dioxygenase (phytanoyl-CoA dioxygenase family)
LGPLEFARSSHRFEHGRDLPISDDSERELQRILATQGFEVDSAPFRVGDASFHLGWTFHRAGPNTSTTARRVMTIIYVDADAVVSAPTNDSQRNDLSVWLGDTPVGAVPDTELNPVLYRA